MKNKEMKKTIPVELEEEALETVSGGSVGTVVPQDTIHDIVGAIEAE